MSLYWFCKAQAALRAVRYDHYNQPIGGMHSYNIIGADWPVRFCSKPKMLLIPPSVGGRSLTEKSGT